MTPIDDASKAGAARTVLLVLGGLGLFGGALATAYFRTPQPGDVLVRATVMVYDQALPAFGAQVHAGVVDDLTDIAPVDGGQSVLRIHGGQPVGAGFSYWRVLVCTPPLDGGGDPGPGAIPGAQIVYDDGDVGPCDGGAPVIEAWQQGRADAPFDCACAVDATCLLSDGGPALPTQRGNTLQPGWRGAGCLPKSCRELGGSSSWPAGCPQ